MLLLLRRRPRPRTAAAVAMAARGITGKEALDRSMEDLRRFDEERRARFRERLLRQGLLDTGETLAFPALHRRVAETGTRACRALRQAGWTPGVIHGTGEDGKQVKRCIKIRTRELMAEAFRRRENFRSTLYRIHVGKADPHADAADADAAGFNDPDTLRNERGEQESYLVHAKTIHLHPMKDNVFMNVNWLVYAQDKALDIPVEYINMSENSLFRRGAMVITMVDKVPVICDGPPPRSLAIDVATSKPHTKFRVRDLHLPDGVRLRDDKSPEELLGILSMTKNVKA